MRKFKRAFDIATSAFFVFCVFLSLTAASAKAQEISSYLFLEVVDFDEKPVQGATIEARDRYASRDLQTGDYGGLRLDLGYYRSTNFTVSLFKISKPGYFSYQDLGTTVEYFRGNVKIELLKIPQTSDEEKNFGAEQKKREFLLAAKTGNAVEVRRFLQSGLSANLSTDDLRGISNPKNIPAILFAAASGNAETVKTLLKAGARIRTKEEPLHSIVPYYLHADTLFSYYDPPSEAQKSKTLLEYEDGLKSLVKSGADVHAVGKHGETTVMIAVQKGYAPLVKFFLDKGVSINAADDYKRTALMYAMHLSPSNSFLPPDADAKKLSAIEMVKFLLKSGADPNIVFRIGNGGCTDALTESVLTGSIELVKVLIDAKADVKLTCENGESALSKAATQRYLEMVKLLIAAGADVKGKPGQTAITEVKKRIEDTKRYADDSGYYRTELNMFNEILKVLEEAAAAR